MNTLYLELFSGISGDMFLGALIDLGVDAHKLEHELEKLPLDGYHLHVQRAKKCGIEGVKFDVHLSHPHGNGHADDHGHDHGHEHSHSHLHGHEHHEHEHEDRGHSHAEARNFHQIEDLIRSSSLSDWVKDKSVAVFRRIAVAEGKIHGHPPEQVHFHEVGAVDSIVDIVGGCIALEMLGKPRVLASSVVEGTGWVNCAHGRLPVPAPATLEILSARKIAISQCDEPHELVTPTGAALLAEFAESFGPMTGLEPRDIGYGLGTRDNHTRVNVLRAVLGDAPSPVPDPKVDWETDSIAVLETNLDDISAEWLGQFVEKALGAGALDVFHTPIQMKKNRPGVLLTVLCAFGDMDRFSEMLLRETTAFGLRRRLTGRCKLQRDFVTVQTPFGEVQIKLGRLNGQIVQAAPEYESCRSAAAKAGVPLKRVYETAQAAVESLRPTLEKPVSP